MSQIPALPTTSDIRIQNAELLDNEIELPASWTPYQSRIQATSDLAFLPMVRVPFQQAAPIPAGTNSVAICQSLGNCLSSGSIHLAMGRLPDSRKLLLRSAGCRPIWSVETMPYQLHRAIPNRKNGSA